MNILALEESQAKCPNNELGGHVYEFVQPNGTAGPMISRCRHCFRRLPGSPDGGTHAVAMKSLDMPVGKHAGELF